MKYMLFYATFWLAVVTGHRQVPQVTNHSFQSVSWRSSWGSFSEPYKESCLKHDHKSPQCRTLTGGHWSAFSDSCSYEVKWATLSRSRSTVSCCLKWQMQTLSSLPTFQESWQPSLVTAFTTRPVWSGVTTVTSRAVSWPLVQKGLGTSEGLLSPPGRRPAAYLTGPSSVALMFAKWVLSKMHHLPAPM